MGEVIKCNLYRSTLYCADYRDIVHLFPKVDALITDVSSMMARQFNINFEEMKKICPEAFIKEAQDVFPPDRRSVSLQACYEHCVSLFPNAKIILDPCMGFGGIGIEALKAGKEFIGVEIKPDRFEEAVRRISELSTHMEGK